jgi:AraC family transcriptional regulator, regulatory protein of adaptative response / DNA-3-methyladenine glycosylase II
MLLSGRGKIAPTLELNAGNDWTFAAADPNVWTCSDVKVGCQSPSENVHCWSCHPLLWRMRLSSDPGIRTPMILDWKLCSRARLSRDARFDGKFFIAVLSTKIYCRPICPARTCKESNVRYYPTAAAAAEAGFRPCLRCRPECSPGTPAWLGTSSTVSRALRLIEETGLQEGGIESLAERLGIGSRHLRRLFIHHLGATPSAVAHTRRLHFAKKLIDDTRLSMGEIAIASGFGCVRRFNAAIRNVYQRTPTEIRRIARKKVLQPENQYLFHLRFRPPYDWSGILSFLDGRATPGVEIVAGDTYRRTISINGSNGYFEVSPEAKNNALTVRVQIGDPRTLYAIVERIRRMFDLNADWTAIVQTLALDPELAERIKVKPGLRVPGCWNGFELTVRAILGRQITDGGAAVLARRLVESLGEPFPGIDGLTHLFPTPAAIVDANLVTLGLTRRRADTIRALSRAVRDRQINFDGIIDCDAFLTQLLEIPDVGRWTAQYVAMRALGEPDAFPTGDAALLSTLRLASCSELDERAEAWRPWRAYATMYLWNVHGEPIPRKKKYALPHEQRSNRGIVNQHEIPA